MQQTSEHQPAHGDSSALATRERRGVALTQGRLVDRLRAYLFTEEAVASAPFSEAHLAAMFGVSRTPVREALKQLQIEGLVDVRPKVGTFLLDPTPRELIEVFALKEVIEGLAARLLAARGHVSEIDDLYENVTRSKSAVANVDGETYSTLVLEYHTTIVRGADSSLLAEHYLRLMNRLAYRRTVARALAAHPARMAHSVGEHEQILSLVRDKDQHGAEAAMRRHVRATAAEALANGRVPLA